MNGTQVPILRASARLSLHNLEIKGVWEIRSSVVALRSLPNRPSASIGCRLRTDTFDRCDTVSTLNAQPSPCLSLICEKLPFLA